MLTKKQILEQLKRENVDLGSNPGRTFVYYQEMGLLPKSENFLPTNKTVALFPNWTPNLIKNIKAYQREGKKLFEIKKDLEESGRTIKEWAEVLKLDSKEIRNITRHIIQEEGMHYLISVFFPDKIQWFKVDKFSDPFHIAKDIQILDTKTLSFEEYGELAKKLAIEFAKKKHKILRDRDIELAIFS